jgi:hypothetical protein
VRRELEDAIEYEGTALEEDVTPVPTIVLDNVVCFCFYPEVECDQCEAANPSLEITTSVK